MHITAVIEQTYRYPKRMRYYSETGAFEETGSNSLMYLRNFRQPYGWIKESGTPPMPHWDVIVMTEKEYELGAEVPVEIIGVFCRNDGDHKMIAVERERNIHDYEQLSESEKEDLHRLYPRVSEGEGFFGRERAYEIYQNCDKPL